MISVRHTGRVVETAEVKQLVIPYHNLPSDPRDCLALHRSASRVLADDLAQVLVVDCN